MDADFANTIYHYMEVIEKGTLNLPNWNHTTSLELDGSMLFALPLYYITGNMFRAVGISNILIMVLYLCIIGRLLQIHHVDKRFIYLTLTLVLTPYGYGMLDYFNMMFFGGACYSIKTLVPILLLLILSMAEKEDSSKKRTTELFFWMLLYLFLLFATSFSTGIYVVLCGIMPVFVWMIFEMFLTGTWETVVRIKTWGIWGLTLLVFGVGYGLHNHVYTAVSRTNMNLTRMGEFADNFDACIRGIYELFGAVTLEEVPVLSLEGVILCVKMVFVTAFLISLFFHYLKFSNKSLKMEPKEIVLKNYLAFLFVWNFMVMFLVDMRYSGNEHTEYRYFLIGAVPLILLFGLQLNSLEKTFQEFQKYVAYVALFGACVVLIYGNHRNVVEKWDRSTYALEVTEYVDSLGVESVIFVADPDSMVKCKGIDHDHEYGCWMPDTQSMYLSICSYMDSAYGEFYGKRHVLAAIEGTDLYQCMPAEIADGYLKIDKFKWFDIYISEEMRLP